MKKLTIIALLLCLLTSYSCKDSWVEGDDVVLPACLIEVVNENQEVNMEDLSIYVENEDYHYYNPISVRYKGRDSVFIKWFHHYRTEAPFNGKTEKGISLPSIGKPERRNFTGRIRFFNKEREEIATIRVQTYVAKMNGIEKEHPIRSVLETDGFSSFKVVDKGSRYGYIIFKVKFEKK